MGVEERKGDGKVKMARTVELRQVEGKEKEMQKDEEEEVEV